MRSIAGIVDVTGTDISDELPARVALLEKHLELVERHFGAGLWRALDAAYELSLPQRELRCIVCNHAGPRTGFQIRISTCMFGGGKLERYVCPACDCIFGPQKYLDLDEDFVDRDYRILYARYSEADSTENELRTFRSLGPQHSGLYLDWGCGGAWSRTVETARRERFEVYGYEPTAPESNNFVVNQRGAISARFDGIFSNNVIEHFRDPVAQFNDFHDLLKEGGLMAHSSPCYDYSYEFSRFHSLFLLGRSPHVLAERTGFSVRDSVRDGEYINFIFERL
jgi:SAM-dependent methyltransferase